MVVAMTIIAVVFTSLAFVLFGSMRASAAARQRASFTEIVNEQIEALRSLPYAQLGVKDNDPNLASGYGASTCVEGCVYSGNPPTFGGRPAVILPALAAPAAPPAVSRVLRVDPVTGATSELTGISFPYFIRRAVTWTDTTGGSTTKFKRLDVEVQWTEGSGAARRITLTSLVYPGNQGRLPNVTPVASFTYSPASPASGTAVTFTATASDPDGNDPLSYAWSWGDSSPAGAGPTTTHTYLAGGPYNVVLTVTDARGAAAVVQQVVTVAQPPNGPPTGASFTVTDPTGTSPRSVTFVGSATDPEGDTLAYTWDFGNGQTGSGRTVSHAYAAVSATTTYTVTMTVRDPGGGSAVATNTVRLDPPAACGFAPEGTFNYFTQKNVAGTNTVFTTSDGSVNNANKTFTFYARTTSTCVSVSGELPLAGSALLSASPMGRVAGAPSGYQDWRSSVDIGTQKFNPTGGARTWDLKTPAGGALVKSQAFVLDATAR